MLQSVSFSLFFYSSIEGSSDDWLSSLQFWMSIRAPGVGVSLLAEENSEIYRASFVCHCLFVEFLQGPKVFEILRNCFL